MPSLNRMFIILVAFIMCSLNIDYVVVNTTVVGVLCFASNGAMVSSEVTAEFKCDCRLSGMPGTFVTTTTAAAAVQVARCFFVNIHCLGWAGVVVVDMSMHFNRPELIDDASFHRCVRYKGIYICVCTSVVCACGTHYSLFVVWEKQKHISFIPPDGKFTLMTFRCVSPRHSCNFINSLFVMLFSSKGQIQLPLLVEPKVFFFFFFCNFLFVFC